MALCGNKHGGNVAVWLADFKHQGMYSAASLRSLTDLLQKSFLQSRFLSAYYVGNVLVLASYWLLRPLAEPATVVGSHAKLATYVRPLAALPRVPLTASCCRSNKQP